jgi:hypothetical protein
VRSRCAVAFLLAALAHAGCGGAERNAGTATLGGTRDRGAVVMVDAKVAAGQTLIRALRSKANVETRYGGRFVQAIDGVEGSLSKRHDWFWLVNGLSGDRSAAEYRVRAGDVVWWDYRDWRHDADLAVVVGAFPEPFLHGYNGKVRPVAVAYELPSQREDARAIARRLHARSVNRDGGSVPSDWNLFVLDKPAGTRFVARQRSPGGPSSPIVLTFSGDVGNLLEGRYQRRFSVP